MKLLAYEIHENSKHQNTNIKQIRMTEIQNNWITAKNRIGDLNVLVIGICILDIVCYLYIEIWDFNAVSGNANRLQLNQLKLTLRQSCQHLNYI